MAIIKRNIILIVGAALLGAVFLLSYFYAKDFFNGHVSSSQSFEEIHPQEVKAGLLKAQAFYNAGHREQAISLLQSLTHQYPQDAFVHFTLGVYLLTEGKFSKDGNLENLHFSNVPPEEGLTHIHKAVELAPTKREYRYVYALHVSELGRYKLAISEFEKIFSDDHIRKDPKYRRLIINFAEALAITGQSERAFEEYRKSLSIAPDDKIIADAYETFLNQRKIKEQKR